MREALLILSFGALALGLASCGDSPARPDPTPPTTVPARPSPTPNPGPTPKPRPTPPPTPGNTAPVAKVGVQIETVTCDGVPQKSNTSWDKVKVGCKMFFDATPKDDQNQRTTPKEVPVWTFEPAKLVDVNLIDPFTPIALALDPGELTVVAEVDGIRSKPLVVQLYY